MLQGDQVFAGGQKCVVLDGPVLFHCTGTTLHFFRFQSRLSLSVSLEEHCDGFTSPAVVDQLWVVSSELGRDTEEVDSDSTVLLLFARVTETAAKEGPGPLDLVDLASQQQVWRGSGNIFSNSNSSSRSASDCKQRRPITPRRHHWLCLSISVGGGGGTESPSKIKVRSLPCDKLVPADYGFIATTILMQKVYSPEFTPSSSSSSSSSSSVGLGGFGDLVSKQFFVVGTSYRQTVILRDGYPLHCIAMDFAPLHMCVWEVSNNWGLPDTCLRT